MNKHKPTLSLVEEKEVADRESVEQINNRISQVREEIQKQRDRSLSELGRLQERVDSLANICNEMKESITELQRLLDSKKQGSNNFTTFCLGAPTVRALP